MALPALEAYNSVIALNASKVFGAWIRKSDIPSMSGRYNDSLDASDGALNVLPNGDKKSRFSIWRDEDIAIYHSAWLADDQILRTSSAWYNRSCGDFEIIIVVNSDLVAAWQRPAQSSIVSLQGAHNAAQVSRDAGHGMHLRSWAADLCPANDPA